MLHSIDLTAYKQDKQLCVVNNATMHILYVTSSKSNALEMINAPLCDGTSYAARGYVIQTWCTVINAVKEYNKI